MVLVVAGPSVHLQVPVVEEVTHLLGLASAVVPKHSCPAAMLVLARNEVEMMEMVVMRSIRGLEVADKVLDFQWGNLWSKDCLLLRCMKSLHGNGAA